MTEPVGNTHSHVLLVDDQKESLMTLEEILRPLGQNVVAVQSGEAALRELMTKDFAVILIDVRMPGMDGFETVARIKSREKTKHVPVIFLTAGSDDIETALRGYSEGAVDYLMKPFVPDVLRSKVAVFVALNTNARLLREQTELLERSNIELMAMAEAAEAASRAKTAFLNMVGHELRTPLTVLNGYASLLMNGAYGELDERQRRPIEVLEQKSEELADLVDMLLTAAQVEANEVPEQVEQLDVNEVVREAMERLQPRADLAGAETVFELYPEPLMVDFDRQHLARILDNLLNNALNYSDSSAWVQVRVDRGDEGPEIFVQDRGVGIPDELQQRIFDRFVRGSAAGDGPPGSGLGLYISRELLNRRGGSLELVDSKTDLGSCFVIRLPAMNGGNGDARSMLRHGLNMMGERSHEPQGAERAV